LNYKPEGVSLKVPGSPRFGNHLDLKDEGRFQCAIALTDGAFTVVPSSHAVDVKEWQLLNNFYVPAEELSKHGLASLDLRCSRGDVMIWVGGRTVHGSPPVSPDGCNRVFTYAQFWPPKKSGKRLLSVDEAISCQSVSWWRSYINMLHCFSDHPYPTWRHQYLTLPFRFPMRHIHASQRKIGVADSHLLTANLAASSSEAIPAIGTAVSTSLPASLAASSSEAIPAIGTAVYTSLTASLAAGSSEAIPETSTAVSTSLTASLAAGSSEAIP
jgi:hypothetical protein